MNNTNLLFGNQNSLDNESIDIKRYIGLFLSNWYWFVIGLLLSISIAYGINRWSEKIYTVSSTLLIKDDQNSTLTDIFTGPDGLRNQQNLKNEIGILKSFNLNYRVMQELPQFGIIYTSVGKRGIAESRLYNNCPFIVLADSLNHQTFNKKIYIKILPGNKYLLETDGGDFKKEMSFGERFVEMGFDFTINQRKNGSIANDSQISNRYYFYFVKLEGLASTYRNKLTIRPIEEDASLVVLTTTGFVPEQEADYLNKLMNVYLKFGLEYKNQTAAQTVDFIGNQLLTISDSLEIAASDLERFRLNNNLIDISREGLIIQGKLEQIDEERTRLKLQRDYYDYLSGYLESKIENIDIVAPSVLGITDQLLIKLVDELAVLQKQKRQLSMNIIESSEPLRVIESNIINARNSLKENIKNGIQVLDRSITEAGIRLANIEKEIRELPSTERQMINIQRKFDINNTVYTFLLEKRAEADIAKASNVPDNRIIDNAGYFSSSMIKPRESRNYLIAIFLGLMVPILSITLLDLLNNKIIDKKDIEKITSAPVIGYINHNSLKTEMPVIENPGSTLSESFRSVRTNLKYFLSEEKCPVISVSSTVTSEGKTFVSANLAVILAMSEKRVLLIGLDLRKPRIHKVFGLPNDSGMSNYLIGDETYDGIIKYTGITNLWYAPSGPVPPNPAELIESEKMRMFIEESKTKFDYVIIDTPPVAIVTDALLVSDFTSFYLFVIRQRYSSKGTLELIDELYKGKNIKSLGLVVNDISISGYYGYGLRYGQSMGYGYNYGYNYYNQYGKYGHLNPAKGYYRDNV